MGGGRLREHNGTSTIRLVVQYGYWLGDAVQGLWPVVGYAAARYDRHPGVFPGVA